MKIKQMPRLSNCSDVHDNCCANLEIYDDHF